MKIALITGATSGIGKAIAERFANEGLKLILCGRNSDALTQIKQELSTKTAVFTLQFDVRNAKDVQEAITSLPKDFENIDILINNAGNAHGLSPLSDGDFDDWDAMLDSNVKGLLYVSKPIIQKMKERRTGHVVNISSIAGRQTYANGVMYCASKKAVDVISEGMRIELTEFGIKVSNIQPGAVETNFSMVRFKGDEEKAAKVYEGFQPLLPEDIADTVFYIINAPKHVSIAEVCLYPTAQAEARTIYRK